MLTSAHLVKNYYLNFEIEKLIPILVQNLNLFAHLQHIAKNKCFKQLNIKNLNSHLYSYTLILYTLFIRSLIAIICNFIFLSVKNVNL